MFIDGGHLRAISRQAELKSDPDFIEKIAHSCVAADEELFRVLYYDCAPYVGKTKKPATGAEHEFKGNDNWLRVLAAKDLFAVRRGVLKFRGWKPKNIPVAPKAPSDSDFAPDFEQKGVDMRIGLDMATCASTHSGHPPHRVILLTGDTDCVPAMKHVRKAGLQVVLVVLPDHRPAPELLWHTDIERKIAWP